MIYIILGYAPYGPEQPTILSVCGSKEALKKEQEIYQLHDYVITDIVAESIIY